LKPTDDVALEAYPSRVSETVRYSDTDRQGHVNNAVFATYFETGRMSILYAGGAPLADAGSAFVIAHLVIDYRAEIHWPGEVSVATRIARIGRSSVQFEQAMFQSSRCVATGTSVIVLTDEQTRRSRPLTAAMVERLSGYIQFSR